MISSHWETVGREMILHFAVCILHLNHSRPVLWRSQHRMKAPPSNKEQTPLGDLRDPNPRFHGGCFGV